MAATAGSQSRRGFANERRPSRDRSLVGAAHGRDRRVAISPRFRKRTPAVTRPQRGERVRGRRPAYKKNRRGPSLGTRLLGKVTLETSVKPPAVERARGKNQLRLRAIVAGRRARQSWRTTSSAGA